MRRNWDPLRRLDDVPYFRVHRFVHMRDLLRRLDDVPYFRVHRFVLRRKVGSLRLKKAVLWNFHICASA